LADNPASLFLRRAGWSIAGRLGLHAWGQSYDLSWGSDRLRFRVLSTFDLERQIARDGATWFDRELAAREREDLASHRKFWSYPRADFVPILGDIERN